MQHVLVGGPIHMAGLERLQQAGLSFDMVSDLTPPENQKLLQKADALLLRTQKLPADLINKAERLKILSRHGVGYDNVDMEALNRRQIPLCVVGDANSASVAEHTMMLILALARRVSSYDQQTRAGHWRYRDGLYASDIKGKRLLLLGGGRIGRAVAKRALAFEMQVAIHDPALNPAQLHAWGVEHAASLFQALPKADILSVHIPPDQEGRPVIGAQELAALKPGAMVINTARGGIIDEAALSQALKTRHVSAAGLDVFAQEPPGPHHILFQHENVILTPHAAGLSQEAAIRMSVMAAQNIIDFFAGQLDPHLIVNQAGTMSHKTM